MDSDTLVANHTEQSETTGEVITKAVNEKMSGNEGQDPVSKPQDGVDLRKSVALLEKGLEELKSQLERSTLEIDTFLEKATERRASATENIAEAKVVDVLPLVDEHENFTKALRDQLSVIAGRVNAILTNPFDENPFEHEKTELLGELRRLEEENERLRESQETLEEKLQVQEARVRRLQEENGELRRESRANEKGDVVIVDDSDEGEFIDELARDGEREGRDSDERGTHSPGSDEHTNSSSSGDGSDDEEEFNTPADRMARILTKGGTLEELFIEELQDELMTSFGCRDKTLMDFFARPNIVSGLVRYLTRDDFEKEFQREAYPFSASEILTAGISNITDALCQVDILEQLFSFLDLTPPLPNPKLAAYWYKVASFLFTNRSMELSVYLKDKPGLLPKVINHIGCESIMNLLLTMLNVEAKLEHYGDEFQWSHIGLISAIAAKLDDAATKQNDYPAMENISEFLGEIITKYPYSSPLVIQLQELPFVRQLVKNTFNPVTGTVHTLSILNNLLQISANPNEYESSELPPVITEILAEQTEDEEDRPRPDPTPLQVLHDILAAPLPRPGQPPLEIPRPGHGEQLGTFRLKLVECVTLLLKTNYFWVDNALLENQIISCVLDLFFHFRWNNVLHSTVEMLVLSILPPQSQSGDLSMVVLRDYNLVDRIVREYTSYYGGENEHALHRTSNGNGPDTGLGYMGHLVNVANAVEKASAVYQPISNLLQANPGWQGYLLKLEKINKINTRPPL